MKTQCPYDDCDKILSSKFNLQRHINTCHLRIKRFECAVCFKLFASKQNLQEHRYVHEEITLEASEIPLATGIREEIAVPKLTAMLGFSHDVLFRPYLHVNRVYPYPVVMKEVLLAAIGALQKQGELPKLETMRKL